MLVLTYNIGVSIVEYGDQSLHLNHDLARTD